MLIVGSLLALVCGVANSAAAALEKRETVRVASSGEGLRLLAVLVRRGWWLLAMALSVLAWSAEAGALGLAPVPVVTTLRSTGRAGLVVAGHRWLGERFGRLELTGVVLLALGGIVTASSVVATHRAARPLSNLTEALLAAATVAVAWVLARTRQGLLMGLGVGVLYIATGIYTKEVGDRVVRYGPHALLDVLATPGPWVMIAVSVWAISMSQDAFRRANAASVAAASSAISADGLIIAGVVLYRQPLGPGTDLVPMIVGVVVSTVGAVALALGGRSATQIAAAAGEPPAA